MKVLGMEERNWSLDASSGASGRSRVQELEREFPAWVRSTRDDLYATLFRIVRNEDDAEELLQDTYLRALTRLGSFRGEGSPEAWLRRIAVRLALNHLRVRKLRRWLPLGGERYQEGEIEIQVVDPGPLPDRAARSGERRRRLETLLRGMPAKAQAAFALRQLEDRPYSEIAALIGCSEATARSLVSRTSSRLEREIRQRGWHDE